MVTRLLSFLGSLTFDEGTVKPLVFQNNPNTFSDFSAGVWTHKDLLRRCWGSKHPHKVFGSLGNIGVIQFRSGWSVVMSKQGGVEHCLDVLGQEVRINAW